MSDKRNPYTSHGVGKNVQLVAFLLIGCLIACCGGGLSVYGDYTGPPEGLAASNRSKMMSLAVFLMIGLIFAVVGIYRYRKAPKNIEQPPSEDS